MGALVDQGALWPSLSHPCGTCAMLPEALGALLQGTVYAVAEKAADLIRQG